MISLRVLAIEGVLAGNETCGGSIKKTKLGGA